jgi:hypothetical protein
MATVRISLAVAFPGLPVLIFFAPTQKKLIATVFPLGFVVN